MILTKAVDSPACGPVTAFVLFSYQDKDGAEEKEVCQEGLGWQNKVRFR